MTLPRERIVEAIAAEINRQTAGGNLPAYALDRQALADAVLKALGAAAAPDGDGKTPDELNGSNDD
ncbi:MAG TPA: hypothetical protein VGM83_03115 [Devosiaceae bacterium]